MSQFVHSLALVLKLALVVVIIAAWVEANAKRVNTESPAAEQNAQSGFAIVSEPLKPDRTDAPAKGAPAPGADCSPRFDKRNVQRSVPARPAIITTRAPRFEASPVRQA